MFLTPGTLGRPKIPARVWLSGRESRPSPVGRLVRTVLVPLIDLRRMAPPSVSRCLAPFPSSRRHGWP
jgi:hypothetical protein